MKRFNSLTTNKKDGSIDYRNQLGGKVSASLNLLLIREAWHKGLCLESECDGYGEGMGTNEDWSGIRDSSDESKDKMLEKALNFLFKG